MIVVGDYRYLIYINYKVKHTVNSFNNTDTMIHKNLINIIHFKKITYILKYEKKN